MWSTKNYNTSSRSYINSILRTVALSSLTRNQKRANFIDQHDNAPAQSARLTVVNVQFANTMSAIKLLIVTLTLRVLLFDRL